MKTLTLPIDFHQTVNPNHLASVRWDQKRTVYVYTIDGKVFYHTYPSAQEAKFYAQSIIIDLHKALDWPPPDGAPPF